MCEKTAFQSRLENVFSFVLRELTFRDWHFASRLRKS